MSALDKIHQTHRQSAGLGGESSSSEQYSDPYDRDKVRLGKEIERDFGQYSFSNNIGHSNGSPRKARQNDYTRDYSMDYKGGGTDTGDSNDFFPRSPAPSTHDLSKHFQDFSMNAVDTSLESVEMPRGSGKEMGTPELDAKDFDRLPYKTKLVDDHDLSSQLHSPSSHGRSVSISDFADLKRPFSPVEKYGRPALKSFPSDLDKELKSMSTPRTKQQLPERPRSAFVERYSKPSPPFQRPRNPVGKTIESEYTNRPAISTLPRSFKDTAQLFTDLGIATNVKPSHKEREMPMQHQSFRLPDMTGIHSLINTTPKASNQKLSTSKYAPIESIPVPKEEKDIISGLQLLREKVENLTDENKQHKNRIRELENELRHQRRLCDIERARAADSENKMLRRSSRDSGFESIEDSDEALERQKAVHAKDRMSRFFSLRGLMAGLETQLATLRSKIVLLEEQLESERERTRSLREERDEAVRTLAVALDESQGMKTENRALRAEIATLRKHWQDNSRLDQKQRPKTAKERLKERVEVQRGKDVTWKGRHREPTVEGSGGFIDAGEIEELRKEIRALREANGKDAKPGKMDPKADINNDRTLDQITTDAQGNVQTIRIQLENAKDHKTRNRQNLRRRRIRRVIVESDLSSDEESDADNEIDETSESSEEENEQALPGKSKKSIPIQPWLRPPGHVKSGPRQSEIQSIISGLAKHSVASCSVCDRKRRLKGKTREFFARKPLGELGLNDLTEPLFEGESIRPSVPPKQALSSVLDQLKDEFHHLQLQYRDLTTKYEGLDPSRGKRKRKAIADRLRDILEEFEAKADQIYSLYDVVEGAGLNGMGDQSRRGWLEL